MDKSAIKSIAWFVGLCSSSARLARRENRVRRDTFEVISWVNTQPFGRPPVQRN